MQEPFAVAPAPYISVDIQVRPETLRQVIASKGVWPVLKTGWCWACRGVEPLAGPHRYSEKFWFSDVTRVPVDGGIAELVSNFHRVLIHCRRLWTTLETTSIFADYWLRSGPPGVEVRVDWRRPTERRYILKTKG